MVYLEHWVHQALFADYRLYRYLNKKIFVENKFCIGLAFIQNSPSALGLLCQPASNTPKEKTLQGLPRKHI